MTAWVLASFFFVVALCEFVLLAIATRDDSDVRAAIGPAERETADELLAVNMRLHSENAELVNDNDEKDRRIRGLVADLLRERQFRREVKRLVERNEAAAEQTAERAR